MKIFVCEHIGATPPVGSSVSSSAGFRGDIMLRSLLADISRIEALEVLTLPVSLRRSLNEPGNRTLTPLRHEAALEAIDDCMQQADAVWPLAPESNGLLESISRRAIQHRKKLLGSTQEAVHVSASKYRTSQALQASGIPIVPTYRVQARLPDDSRAWVVKPDDGAGCSDTHIFLHPAAATDWIAAQQHGDYVLQPYVPGRPCNLSLLCCNGDILLMGCNDQRVAVSDNQFHYMGSIVNSIDDADGKLKDMARRVLTAIPGMWGYVGIDFILTGDGPIILEVNPRMTVSHIGLHASIGANPVQILLDTMNRSPRDLSTVGKSRQVSVDINARHNTAHVVE